MYILFLSSYIIEDGSIRVVSLLGNSRRCIVGRFGLCHCGRYLPCWIHKLGNQFICHFRPIFLEVLYESLQQSNTLGFQLAREQRARPIVLRKLLIILKEEPQILIGDIDLSIASFSSMLLFCLLTTTEPMFVDFVLELIRCVRHEYTAVYI
jgi:hypothetical protein